MSLITEYQDSNDRRQDIKPPVIKVASLPPTMPLTPAPLEPVIDSAPLAPLPAPSTPPQVETPAIDTQAPLAAPQPPQNEDVVVDPVMTPQVQPPSTPEEFAAAQANTMLNTDISSLQKASDRSGVSYDVVNGVGASNPGEVRAEEEVIEQLRATGEWAGSGDTTPENLQGFIPTLYNSDAMPYFGAVNNQAQIGQNAAIEDLATERQKVVEQGFQPQTIPQLEEDPRKPRPDSTKPFNNDWLQWLNKKLTPGTFDPQRGKFGEAGNGWVGGLLYTLGLPQNLVFGAGLDVEKAVEQSPLAPVYHGIGDIARGGLQAGLNVLGAGANLINKNIFGMGEVNTQLPTDFDPVRADPKFKGSYAINALRGSQYSFSGSAGKDSPMGIVTEGNNPTMLFGLAADVASDPTAAAMALLAPLKKGGRVARAVGKAAEIVVDPISEAVVPALGHAGTKLRGVSVKPPNVEKEAETVVQQATKKPGKKKASQAGIAKQLPPAKAVTQEAAKPLEEAYKAKMAARAARAEKAKVANRVLVTPAKAEAVVPEKVTVLRTGGAPITHTVEQASPAIAAVENQSEKVVLQAVTPEALVARNHERLALPPAKERVSKPVVEQPENGVIITPSQALIKKEIDEVRLVPVDDVGTVVHAGEARKVAEQTQRKEEAELLRLTNKQVMAEQLAPGRAETIQKHLSIKNADELAADAKKVATDYANDDEWKQFNADYDARVAARQAGKQQIDSRQTPIGSQLRLQTVDEVAAASKKIADDYANDPEWKQFNEEYSAKLTDKITVQQTKVAEAKAVAESIPQAPTPSEIPTVSSKVFSGDMSVSEVADAIARFVPGTAVDTETIKKTKRTTGQLTELMKLTPHPTSGKPLVAASKRDFKTYTAIHEYLMKQGIEDPTYFRMFGRDGSPIPDEIFTSPNFRMVTGKTKPFAATPSVVVEPGITRVVAGQIEKPGELPGVKLDRSVKVSYMEPTYKPVETANKSSDYRGALKKERNVLKRQLDEVDSPEEMEKILEHIADIDEELASPSLKSNPGHLEQLQAEVIPDTQHGTSSKVIDLTEQKLELETRIADVSDEVRTLDAEVRTQEDLLEKTLAQIENTADVGRRELADGYTPEIPPNGITDNFFETPANVGKMSHANNTMYFTKTDEEFFKGNASIVMRALDEVQIPGGVDVVYLTKNMIHQMSVDDLQRLKSFIAEPTNAAFMDWKTQKLFVRDALFDSEMDAGEATRIIVHELGHKLHGRNNMERILPLREKYRDVMAKEKGAVSEYAANQKNFVVKIDEDFAESVSFYRANPYKFAERFPQRARVIAEELETSAAETLNAGVLYHGTRTPEWQPIVDPLTTEARSVWGQATYLHVNVEDAVNHAQAELPVNTPGLLLKDVDSAGSVYQVKPNFERVLRATDIVTPTTQRIFGDAMEDVLGRKTPETRKAIKHFIAVTSPKTLEDGSIKYPRYQVKQMYGLVEKYAAKYLGELPEETLSDLTRAINLKLREAGYDAIYDVDTVAVLKHSNMTAINREMLNEADTTDVLIARYNADSAAAAANPMSATAQIDHMESAAKLQAEMLEQTKNKLKAAQDEQLRKLDEWQHINRQLSEEAGAEQAEKQLMKKRESEAKQAAEEKRLSKPLDNPCVF